MSLRLTLLPFVENNQPYSFQMLSIEPLGDLLDIIYCLEKNLGRDVPIGFKSYTSREGDPEPHYGVTETTPYGEKLQAITAGQLWSVMDHPQFLQPTSLYVSAMHPSTLVALYWH